MAFGVYVHIPYCLQICTYCDFAKFEVGTIPPQEHYTKLLLQEISQKEKVIPKHTISSIYFGGGTPSLMSPAQIQKIMEQLRSSFPFSNDIEITLEINPGTISKESLQAFLNIGVNRFSVGVQTFQSELLKITGRKHSVKDSIDTLEILKSEGVNYSLDILYALPGQSIKQLTNDLSMAGSLDPSHVSCYYLTVPSNHPLNQNRPTDEAQEKMMDTLEEMLLKFGIKRYEISNYSKPGKESRHNLVYWQDAPYWGIGLGAHSYLAQDLTPFGVRFWNPTTYKSYENYVNRTTIARTPYDGLKNEAFEVLQKHQALTDYCHTFLRTLKGLNVEFLEEKFAPLPSHFYSALDRLVERNLLIKDENILRLSKEGLKLANLVFEELTFLKDHV